MKTNVFMKNLLLMIYLIIITLTILKTENISLSNSHELLTQHGNLICKGEIESRDMKTTANGHLYASQVNYIIIII